MSKSRLIGPALVLWLSSLASAQGHRISGELATVPAGFVREVRLSADGKQVAFLDDGLQRSLLAGGEPLELAPRAFPESDHELSADGSRIVFRHGQRLFSVASDGSSEPLEISALAYRFEIAPDSRTVVFSRQDRSLWRVPLGEMKAPENLMPAVGPTGGNDELLFSADSRHVAHLANGELRLANLDPSRPALSVASEVTGMRFDPSGTSLVYRARPAGRAELFVLDLGGLTSRRLHGPLQGEVETDLQFAAGYVFFGARLAGQAGMDLLRADLGGGATLALTPPSTFNRTVLSIQAAPDSSEILYIADQGSLTVLELFAVSIDGSSAPRRLNAPLVHGGDVLDFMLTPDGSRAIYRADQVTDGVFALYSARRDRRTAPVRLADSPVPTPLRFGAQGRELVFMANGLLAVPVDGSAAARTLLSAPSTFQTDFTPVPASPFLLVRAAIEAESRLGIYRFDLDSSAPPVRLSRSPFGRASSSVLEFHLTSDARRALYSSHPLSTLVGGSELIIPGEVRSLALDGSRPERRLYPDSSVPESALASPSVAGIRADGAVVIEATDELGSFGLFANDVDGRGLRLLATSDHGLRFLGFAAGERVVYVQSGATTPRLFSTALDGSTPPFDVTPSGAGFVDDFEVRLDPTGTRLLAPFFTSVGGNTSWSLWSVPVDGTVPVQLESPLSSNEAILAHATPDGARAVFTLREAGATGLYSAPIDGSAPPIRLNAASAAGSIVVWGGEFSPIDGRALFVEYDAGNGHERVAVVPPNGGLAVTLALLPRIARARFSPDGQTVAFTAGSDLYTVSVAGGTARKLNPPLVTGGLVRSFQFTPDGARLIYLADAIAAERVELWSVATGGGPALRLNHELSEAGRVLAPFVISADGSRVLYQGSLDQGLGLFSASTARAKSAHLVSAFLRGEERPFAFAERSDHVLYLADEEEAGEIALYETFLARVRRR